MIKRLVRQIVHRERAARGGICGLDRLMCAVDREAERPHALVGIVEADAVFGFDVVPIPLRFANQLTRGSELLVRRAGFCRRLDGEVRLGARDARRPLQLEGVVVDRLDACNEHFLALIVALEACVLDVLQGAGNIMRRVLLPVLAHVRHVAVDAGDARVRMDARLPDVVVGMLRLEHHRARVGMLPVALEAARQIGALVVLVHLLRRVAVVTREHDAAFLALLEVILRMALAADEGALVVVADLVPGLAPVALKIFDLRRDHEAQFHRLHVMTGGAGDRSRKCRHARRVPDGQSAGQAV